MRKSTNNLILPVLFELQILIEKIQIRSVEEAVVFRGQEFISGLRKFLVFIKLEKSVNF